jgi:hypothetical protein
MKQQQLREAEGQRAEHGAAAAMVHDQFDVGEQLVLGDVPLDPQQRAALHHALQHVLTAVAKSGAHGRFGVCSDCMHLGGDTSCRPAGAIGSSLECRLLGTVIRPEEMDLLCVKFQAGARL